MAEKTIITDDSYESIVEQASKTSKGLYSFSKTYPAYIVLIVALAISIGAWYLIDQKVKSDNILAFDKAESSVMTRLDMKYNDNLHVLNSIHSIYDYYVEVNRDLFELYGDIPIKSYRSIMTMVYAPEVSHNERDVYIYNTRSEGYWYYEIYPEGQREKYYPIQYIVPLDINFNKSGYDLMTDPTAKKAIDKARDSAMTVATEVYKVRKPDTTGFYIISPIFMRDSTVETLEDRRKHFQGALILEIGSPIFFERALGEGVASDTSIIFECVDFDNSGKKNIVYQSKNYYLLKQDYEPDLTGDHILKIADREIHVLFKTIPNFGGSFQKILPALTLGITALIAVAFFGFILSVITRKARAVELADRMTRSQRRIVESSKDIIAALDLDGVWKSMNPASIALFGKKPKAMIGEKIDDSFLSGKDAGKFRNFIRESASDVTKRFVFQMKSSGDEMKWIDWSFSVSLSDGLIYCIGRDITLEKLAEEQAELNMKQNELAEQLTKETSSFKSYFMIKLSHQLRNSLTGIVGYLQLLSQKIYETEEEQDMFVQQAEKSSEELFAFVSDIDDVAGADEVSQNTDIALLQLAKLVADSAEEANGRLSEGHKINVQLTLESEGVSVIADSNLLRQTFAQLYLSLSAGKENCEIQIHAQENAYEGAVEIQMLSQSAPIVEKLIEIYKTNINKLIDSLEQDQHDVILGFAKAASNIRMINGTIKIETFGGDDGNVVFIMLPMNRPGG